MHIYGAIHKHKITWHTFYTVLKILILWCSKPSELINFGCRRKGRDPAIIQQNTAVLHNDRPNNNLLADFIARHVASVKADIIILAILSSLQISSLNETACVHNVPGFSSLEEEKKCGRQGTKCTEANCLGHASKILNSCCASNPSNFSFLLFSHQHDGKAKQKPAAS